MFIFITFVTCRSVIIIFTKRLSVTSKKWTSFSAFNVKQRTYLKMLAALNVTCYLTILHAIKLYSPVN